MLQIPLPGENKIILGVCFKLYISFVEQLGLNSNYCSKRPANVFKIHVLIAGRLLDRVNTLLNFENKTVACYVVLMRYLTSYKVYRPIQQEHDYQHRSPAPMCQFLRSGFCTFACLTWYHGLIAQCCCLSLIHI